MKTILKVLVGSHAHGLANKNSDRDLRGVFVHKTSEILKIGSNLEKTSWVEPTDGKADDTSWEIGHFLFLSTKSNPTILETYLAPVEDSDQFGHGLRSLFPMVWNSKDVMNAFIGYGLNQRKKFLDNKDNRANKYAAAYLRVLYNAYELLKTDKEFTVKIADTEIGKTVRRFKNGDFEVGEVVQICHDWEIKVREAYEKNPDHKTNIDAINDYLLYVRESYW